MHVYIEDCGCYCGMSLLDLNNVALRCFKVVHNKIGRLQGSLYAWAVFIVLTVQLYLLLKVSRSPSFCCPLG